MLCSKKLLFDPERPFSTASKDSRIELILFQTKIYTESQFNCTTESNNIKSAANRYNCLFTRREKSKYGATALQQKKPAKGWQMIHEACEITSQIFGHIHQSLFRYLLDTFNNHDLAAHPDLRTHLLRFFTKASTAILGCNHPVLYNLQEEQILADVVKPAFEVLMDVSGEDLNPTSDEAWRIKEYYCRLLMGQKDYAAAESYGLRFSEAK